MNAVTQVHMYPVAYCPGHEFGSNDGQPVDDHCALCGVHWSRRNEDPTAEFEVALEAETHGKNFGEHDQPEDNQMLRDMHCMERALAEPSVVCPNCECLISSGGPESRSWKCAETACAWCLRLEAAEERYQAQVRRDSDPLDQHLQEECSYGARAEFAQGCAEDEAMGAVVVDVSVADPANSPHFNVLRFNLQLLREEVAAQKLRAESAEAEVRRLQARCDLLCDMAKAAAERHDEVTL